MFSHFKYPGLIVLGLQLLITGCQSTAYKVSGVTEGLFDGDTLFLTHDLQNGIPSDTILVKDGHFSFEGETDSTYLCMVYEANRNEINIPFFIEPGNITIKLSEVPGNSRVGGTKCNEGWQELNDSVMSIGREINRIAEHIYGNTVSPDDQRKGMEQIEKLNQRFAQIVCQTTERNINNEFGYFLLTYYPEELIDNDTRLHLINKLPDKYKGRQAIKQLEETIKAARKSGEGTTIPDFSQSTPDGSPISLMAEVSNHTITIIDFWASWCGPCRHDMPFMVSLYEKYKDKGLGIIGISLDSEYDAWKQAIQQLKITWPQMSDLKGWENSAAQQLNITSIPHTIVVNKKGVILKRGLRGDDLEQYIAQQLGNDK